MSRRGSEVKDYHAGGRRGQEPDALSSRRTFLIRGVALADTTQEAPAWPTAFSSNAMKHVSLRSRTAGQTKTAARKVLRRFPLKRVKRFELSTFTLAT